MEASRKACSELRSGCGCMAVACSSLELLYFWVCLVEGTVLRESESGDKAA